MAKEYILVVEDDTDILEMILYNLKNEGYKTTPALSGEKALEQIKISFPDLIILDIMLPGIDGLDVCKKLKTKEETANIPVIMLTAKSQEADKVLGLELGADDYMTKPFSPKELMARIKAVLRRGKKAPSSTQRIVTGNLVIDNQQHKVLVSEKEIALTLTEFKLLSCLAQNPGILLTRDKILSLVFGYDSKSYSRTIDSHIKSLRKKLGPAQSKIETIRGLGYRFKNV